MTTITNLNLGTTANDGTGTTGRDGGQIINDNFNALNSSKVEVEAGKGLSTNDYTDTEQSKVGNLPADQNAINSSKQDTLVSGTNIKTINGETVLGSGDIVISGGGAVDSVNGQTGVVVLDADDISDTSTTNKYTTQAEIDKLDGIEASATANSTDATLLDRANHTGTQTASTISDFDTEVSNNSSVTANTAKVSADGSINTHSDVNTTTTPPTDGQSLVWNNLSSEWRPGTVAGGGDTINYYNTFKAPQLFNPDAAAVTANTDTYTLSNGAEIGFVTLNGQTLDDSEYSLSGSDLTVTPDNGFNSTSDEVLVFQTKLTATGFDLGWGYYQDGTYTEGSPLSINNARVQLPIDGTGTNTNTTYLPAMGHLWDTTNDKIVMNAIGDSYTIRIDFKVKAGSNNSFFDIQLDIGDGSSIVIVEDTLQMVKGINTEQRFSKTISGFALSTFIANGCKIFLDSTDDAVNLSVYDIAILVNKTK